MASRRKPDRPCILIAEDYDDTRTVMRMALERNGYSVLEAANGREAVEIALRDRPDLILMDINMPVVDGLSATRLIREEEALRSTPVVAFSGYGEELMGDRAREAGCDAYVTTPVGPKELTDFIRRLLPP